MEMSGIFYSWICYSIGPYVTVIHRHWFRLGTETLTSAVSLKPETFYTDNVYYIHLVHLIPINSRQ
jgi:hypothetical protein